MSEAAIDDQNQASPSSNQQLAARLFGADYHGEIPETTDAAPADEQLENEASAQEAADVEAAADADVQEADEAGVEGEGTEDAEEYVTSFAEFTEAEGLDPEFMDGLTASLKVNGEVLEKPFSEIRAAAQMHYAAEDALEQAKAVKKAAQDEQRTNQQNFDTAIQVVSAVVQRSLKAVQDKQAALEASGLRDTDPAEFAVQARELEKQLDAEKATVLVITKAVNEENARRQQQAEQEAQEQLAQGAEKLVQAIPAWSNPEVVQKDAEAVVSYVLGTGFFTEQQVRENTIPGLWVFAHKARLYDELQGAADVTKKRLRKVPKVAKPGAPKTPEQHNQAKAAHAKRQVREATGTEAQIAAAVRAKQLSRR